MRRFLLFAVAATACWLAAPMIDSAARAQEKHAPEAAEATHTDAEHADAEHAGAEHAGEHAEHPTGAPLDAKVDLAIWTLVTFACFLLVLRVFAWGPISEGLNKREAAIAQNIASAEQARIKAEQMLAAHAAKLDKVQDEVREIVAEARRDAEHTKQDIVAQATKEAEATKQRAVTEINRARDTALKELFDVMATQVASATEHVLARSLTDQDHRRLIDEGIAQFRQN